MSLAQAPSVLSEQISTAKAYLRPFGVIIHGVVRSGDMIAIHAAHTDYGQVQVFVTLDAATAEYILDRVMSCFVTRIYTRREAARRDRS